MVRITAINGSICALISVYQPDLKGQLLKYPAKGIRVFKPVKDNPYLNQNLNVPPEKR
jgi:hypothetical protein